MDKSLSQGTLIIFIYLNYPIQEMLSKMNANICNLIEQSLSVEEVRLGDTVIEEFFFGEFWEHFSILHALFEGNLKYFHYIVCILNDSLIAGLFHHSFGLSLFLLLFNHLRLFNYFLYLLLLLFFLFNDWLLLFNLFLLLSWLSVLLIVLIVQESFDKVESLINQVIEERMNLSPLPIDFKRGIFIFDNGNDLDGSLSQSLNFQEGMVMLNSSLASLAEIKVSADRTLVSNTHNSPLTATVAVDSSVNHHA
jgi:hypothetical protein